MFFEGLWRDVVYGARTLWQARSYSAIAVLTLALGIGANTAIFSVVNTVLLKPLPFDAPDRIITLGQQTRRTAPRSPNSRFATSMICAGRADRSIASPPTTTST